MRATRLMALLGTVVVLGGCTGSAGQSAPGTTLPERVQIELALASAIEPFDSCTALAEVARAEAEPHLSAYGLSGVGVRGEFFAASAEGGVAVAAAAPGGQDRAESDGGSAVTFSETNNQEAGVDEPDSVKTDGQQLVTLIGGELRILDVTDAKPRLIGELRFDEGQRPESLFLVDDRVLVFGSGVRPDRVRSPSDSREPAGSYTSHSTYPTGQDGFITSIDIGEPSAPRVASTLWHDGRFVTARLIDGVARVVFHVGGPRGIDFVQPLPLTHPTSADRAAQERFQRDSKEQAEAALAENKRILAEAPGEQWLPEVAVEVPGQPLAPGPVAGCDDVFAPEDVSGTGMVAVLSVDARTGEAGEEAVVLGAAEQVYASTSSLYVVTANWEAMQAPAEGESQAKEITSAVHQFDITDPSGAKYVASGAVPGTMLNQFSMSEHDGVLRVATTSAAWRSEQDESQSYVTTLRRDDKALVQVGQIGGLGKGERIYSVRFIGDTGYVVTFRQTDPLYVVDLRDPAAPKVTGELKIPGYSAYLHPLGDGWLIGLGQDATDQGRVQGTQLSVFDVRDPAAPKRVHVHGIKGASSTAEYDHHAFLHWAATGLTVIPLNDFGRGPVDSGKWFVGAVAFRIDTTDGIDELARVEHPTVAANQAGLYDGPRAAGQIQRSVVVDDRLLTVSSAGVLASGLDDLDTKGWLAFSS